MSKECGLTTMLRCKEKLIAASKDLKFFEKTVQEIMKDGVSIQHIMCINIRICDMTDILPERRLKRLVNIGFYPFEGKMVMFGVAEEWVSASGTPRRQIVFLLSLSQHVFAYEDGVMFYLSPTFEDFWTTKLEFSCQNAITHGMSKKMSRDECHERFINYYHRIRQKTINISGKLPSRFQRVLPGHKLSNDRETQAEKMYMSIGYSENDNLPNNCKIYKMCHTPGVTILVSRSTQTGLGHFTRSTQTSQNDIFFKERCYKPQTTAEMYPYKEVNTVNETETAPLDMLEESSNFSLETYEEIANSPLKNLEHTSTSGFPVNFEQFTE